MAKQYGSITIISPTIQRRKGYRYVLAYCGDTHIEKLASLDNLVSGKTTSLLQRYMT